MRIRHLELIATTANGNFGVSIPFKDGLTVVWADNTKGKSTSMMSILYALGLEGMLGSSHEPPLTDAMLAKLQSGDEELEVIGSYVRLEIENEKREIVTVQRFVQTEKTQDRQLIRVEYGPTISTKNEFDRRDFYVRIAGGAQNEDGFHNFLAAFIGYELPMVNGPDQRRVPLYLECLFPFFFVEQISGWRDVKARMPTYLGIPDMAKRATEFILELDILRREIDRQSLQLRRQKLMRDWREVVDAAKRTFRGTGAMFEDLPEKPPAVWPLSPAPRLLTTDGDKWFTFSEARKHYNRLTDVIANEALPQAEQASEQILAELSETEEELYRAQRSLDDVALQIAAERANVEATDLRLQALNEDLRKYKSTAKVTARSGIAKLKTTNGTCPVCEQPIKDAFLPQDRLANPMSVEENILFLEDQVKTFLEMREESRMTLVMKDERIVGLRKQVAELSAKLRAQKRTLRSDAEAPSIAAIQEQLRIEQRLHRLDELNEKWDAILSDLSRVAKEWIKNQAAIRGVVRTGLTTEDKAKIDRFKRLFVEQLQEYGFSSFKIADLAISEENYRPTVKNTELGVTSASDAVRVIWAYLLGLLEVARSTNSNHIGFVIFDEPKQQSARDISFEALLKRASTSARFGQQVICATSENQDRLADMLEDVPCDYKRFDDWMLKPIDQT